MSSSQSPIGTNKTMWVEKGVEHGKRSQSPIGTNKTLNKVTDGKKDKSRSQSPIGTNKTC